MLAEKRIEYEFMVDNPHDAGSRVSDFNPLGKVPVLVTDDGAAIYDSCVIVEYLDAISPVGRLIPEPGRQRIQVKRWEALADGLMEAAVLCVLEGRRPHKEQSRAWVDRQMEKVNRGLRVASSDLAEKRGCRRELYLGGYRARLRARYRFPLADSTGIKPNLKRHAGKPFKRPPFEATEPRSSSRLAAG
jgi:glutathione S-transferase